MSQLTGCLASELVLSALTAGAGEGVFFTLRSRTSFAEIDAAGRCAELDAWAALAGVERLSGLGSGDTIFGVTDGSLFIGGGVETPLAWRRNTESQRFLEFSKNARAVTGCRDQDQIKNFRIQPESIIVSNSPGVGKDGDIRCG